MGGTRTCECVAGYTGMDCETGSLFDALFKTHLQRLLLFGVFHNGSHHILFSFSTLIGPVILLSLTFSILRSQYYVLNITFSILLSQYYVLNITFSILLSQYYVLKITFSILRSQYYFLNITFSFMFVAYPLFCELFE